MKCTDPLPARSGLSGMCGHGHLALGAFRTCHAGVMDRFDSWVEPIGLPSSLAGLAERAAKYSDGEVQDVFFSVCVHELHENMDQ